VKILRALLNLSSKAQYERQFKTWGFRKNRKESDWIAIAGRIEKRKKAGKDSDVYHDGTMILRDKIHKEISRHVFPKIYEQYGQGTVFFF